MDIFEHATKNKFRFPSKVGVITTEDLWDLPLTSVKGASLDNTAKAINKELKQSTEESFVNERSSANTRLATMLDVVKSVIATKIGDNQKASNAKTRASERGVLMEVLARRETSDLEKLSSSELRNKIAELT